MEEENRAWEGATKGQKERVGSFVASEKDLLYGAERWQQAEGALEHMSIWLVTWGYWRCYGKRARTVRRQEALNADRSITAKRSRGGAMRVKEDAWVCLYVGCNVASGQI